MKKYLTAIASVALLISGCAGIARSNYAGNNTYSDITSAKSKSETIGAIEFATTKKININTDSPLLDSELTKGRFEIVSVNGEKEKEFRFTIFAKCDCLGFRKWSVVPIAFLIDEAGNVIEKGKPNGPTIQFLSGTFPESKTYFVMIVADSASEGKKIGEISGGLPVPGGVFVPNFLTLPITSHPTGIVQVNWQ